MHGGSIGGIPLLWIAMAASARKRKEANMNIGSIGLGDFIIDPVSRQWCRVVHVKRVWKDVPPGIETSKREAWKYKNNRPIPLEGAKRAYENNLKRIGKSGGAYSMDKYWATHEIELEFADGKAVSREINDKANFVCIHAPEIFGFSFDQLKDLTGNSKRGAKSTKKKSTKKKASKKRATKRSAA